MSFPFLHHQSESPEKRWLDELLRNSVPVDVSPEERDALELEAEYLSSLENDISAEEASFARLREELPWYGRKVAALRSQREKRRYLDEVEQHEAGNSTVAHFLRRDLDREQLENKQKVVESITAFADSDNEISAVAMSIAATEFIPAPIDNIVDLNLTPRIAAAPALRRAFAQSQQFINGFAAGPASGTYH